MLSVITNPPKYAEVKRATKDCEDWTAINSRTIIIIIIIT